VTAVVQNTAQWYESAIVGVIVGSIITFVFTYLLTRRKEQKGLENFEYELLSKIHASLLMEDTGERDRQLKELVNKIYFDPRIPKLKSSAEVLQTIDGVLEGKDVSQEKSKIKNRLSKLRKK
jgi:hypothetical protein